MAPSWYLIIKGLLFKISVIHVYQMCLPQYTLPPRKSRPRSNHPQVALVQQRRLAGSEVGHGFYGHSETGKSPYRYFKCLILAWKDRIIQALPFHVIILAYPQFFGGFCHSFLIYKKEIENHYKGKLFRKNVKQIEEKASRNSPKFIKMLNQK